MQQFSELGFPEPPSTSTRPEHKIEIGGLCARIHETREALSVKDELPYEFAMQAFEQAREWAFWGGSTYMQGTPDRPFDIARIADYEKVNALLDDYRHVEGFEGREHEILLRKYLTVLVQEMSKDAQIDLPTLVSSDTIRYIVALGYVYELYLSTNQSRKAK